MSAGLANIKELVDAENNGQFSLYTWRKTPSVAATAGIWFDISLSPGNPVPKFWFDATPYVAKQVSLSADGGLYHRRNVSPLKKYLRETSVICTTVTPLPMTMLLCDYLLYYPTIDESVTDEQFMDNTVSLSRYADGAGVQMILVVTAQYITGGQYITINYINQDGVARSTTTRINLNLSAVNGQILTSSTTTTDSTMPFVVLQGKDTGVRSVTSVIMQTTDVGLFSIILVKPLGMTQIRGIDAPVEVDYFQYQNKMPQIQDDAYLSFLCMPSGSLAAVPIHGTIKTVWN